MKTEVAADIRAIFNAPNRTDSEPLLTRKATKYEKKASRLADWIETKIPEGLTVFGFPVVHHGVYILPTVWNDQIMRSVAGPEWRCSFLTKHLAFVWSLLSFWKLAMTGKQIENIYVWILIDW
jgi:hypothetical protein